MLLYSHATHPLLSKLVAQIASTFVVAAEVSAVVELVIRIHYFESSDVQFNDETLKMGEFSAILYS
jgi:hypothetical protein